MLSTLNNPFPMELMFGQMERKRVRKDEIPLGIYPSANELLVTLGAQTGVLQDPYVFSMAVSYFHSAPLGRTSLRCRVIASLALAVDVCGDYEADYTRSALAWSVLHERGDEKLFPTINAACRSLLAGKYQIATHLDWNLLLKTVGSVVTVPIWSALLHACSLVYVPRGFAPETIGALVLFIGWRDPVVWVPTPNNRYRLRRELVLAKARAEAGWRMENEFIQEKNWIEASEELIKNSPECLIKCAELFFCTKKTPNVLEAIEDKYQQWQQTELSDES